MSKKHYYYIDYMRVFAMCCVVFMHAASSSLRMYLGSANWMVLNVVTSLAFCSVPLFFMISGGLMLNSPKTADISYLLKKRIPKLIVPLAVYSAISAVWLDFLADGSYSLYGWYQVMKKSLDGPIMAHFWFMYTLIGMYIISPILYGGLRSLTSNGKKYLAVIITAGILFSTVHLLNPNGLGSFVPYQFVEEIWFFNGHIIALIIGWYLLQEQRRVHNGILIGTAAAVLIIITLGTYYLTVKSNSYIASFQSQNHGLEILLAICIFLFCKQNLNRPFGKLNEIIKPIANLSFPVYLLHNLVISIFYYHGLPHERALDVGLAALLVIAVCFVIIKTLATIKPLCYIFTGMSYSEACQCCNWVYTFRLIKNIRKTTISV